MTIESTELYLPLKFNQLLELVKQLSLTDKNNLLNYLLNQNTEEDNLTLTHFASEKSLAKDWLTQTEDEAWQDL